MPPKNDIFQTFDLKWGPCKPYDVVAKVDYIEQTDAGLKIHCHKFEKEKKMNKNEELKNVDTIIITRKGNTVSIEAYDECSGVGLPVISHRATAECSPDDIFDFNIGAKLAFDRLYEGYDMTPKPKRKPYNGLIYIEKYPGVVLEDKSIYRVKKGLIVGCRFGGVKPFIFSDMSDDDLSKAIYDNVFGTVSCIFYKSPKLDTCVAHFVNNDKT